MKAVSPPMAELINLVNAAQWHRDHCNEPCNVAIYQLGLTAVRLVEACWPEELEEARRITKEFNWIK